MARSRYRVSKSGSSVVGTSPFKLFGPSLALGLILAAAPALGQTPPQEVDKPARETPSPQPCTDCRGGEGGRPSSSNTVITLPDGKTIVPRPLMREQSDFRLNEALRSVPGVNRR